MGSHQIRNPENAAINDNIASEIAPILVNFPADFTLSDLKQSQPFLEKEVAKLRRAAGVRLNFAHLH
jgi:hypothetical protein